MSDYGRLQEDNAKLTAENESLKAELAELKKPKATPINQPDPEPEHTTKKRSHA